ncbi:MAG: 16S rRNA methyltransferase [Bacteroidetes bacterium QS_9_68_14]|nr:MAG: 16S rRNA methyltransferase [Bacteroidetes bacterium QS_9_68_14]
MTTAFFAPPSAVHGRRLVLPPGEARHATRALRHTQGDEIWVVDGEGRRHRVRLEQTGEEKTVGTILDTQNEAGEPPYQLALGLGLLKRRARYETFLEKAVELGATRLVPLRTRHAERDTLRADRAERLLRAALKQSGRSRLPRLDAPTPFPEALRGPEGTPPGHTLLAHRRPAADPSLTEALAGVSPGRRLRVLVGPEGGFSSDEVEAAEEAGATIVSLGPRRLRAETAALAAAAAVMLALGDGSESQRDLI